MTAPVYDTPPSVEDRVADLRAYREHLLAELAKVQVVLDADDRAQAAIAAGEVLPMERPRRRPARRRRGAG